MSWGNLVHTLSNLNRPDLPRCKVCGMYFTPIVYNATVCSDICSKANHNSSVKKVYKGNKNVSQMPMQA